MSPIVSQRPLTTINVFQLLFGLYLFAHFVALIPVSTELFSSEAVFAASQSPFWGQVPSLLFWNDAPWFVRALLLGAAALSLALAFDVRRRVAAFGIWMVWASLFIRNPLIQNPSLAYVGFVLLVVVADAGVSKKAFSRFVRDERVWTACWVILGLSYTFAGLTKLSSVSWVDGSAVADVVGSPLARTGFVTAVLAEHPMICRALTYGALMVEIAALPLALSRTTRPLLFVALGGLHLGLLTTVRFADLTVAMLVVHLALFDPRWVRGGHLRAMLSLRWIANRWSFSKRSWRRPKPAAGWAAGRGTSKPTN